MVVAAPHERWGETPVAIIVLNPGATLTEREVVQHCADRLGGYKRPSRVIFQEEPLPRTPVGKIPRKQIRETFWVGAAGRVGGS